MTELFFIKLYTQVKHEDMEKRKNISDPSRKKGLTLIPTGRG